MDSGVTIVFYYNSFYIIIQVCYRRRGVYSFIIAPVSIIVARVHFLRHCPQL